MTLCITGAFINGIAGCVMDAGDSSIWRYVYSLGANDPYSSLKTMLNAEINEEAWAHVAFV